MYGRSFRNTTTSRFDNRRKEVLHGEKFYERLTQISREDDVLDRMSKFFSDEIGMRVCPLGNFINIYDRAVSYHGLILPEDVIDEFRSDDGKSVDWRGFIAKCQADLRISFDLDEALGKFHQWMLYNDLTSMHQIFDNDYEIDQDTFQTVCKKAGANLERNEIARVFAKYSKNMLLDYDYIADIFEEKKRDDLFMAKYQ